jgi:hypothetical protein
MAVEDKFKFCLVAQSPFTPFRENMQEWLNDELGLELIGFDSRNGKTILKVQGTQDQFFALGSKKIVGVTKSSHIPGFEEGYHVGIDLGADHGIHVVM